MEILHEDKSVLVCAVHSKHVLRMPFFKELFFFPLFYLQVKIKFRLLCDS